MPPAKILSIALIRYRSTISHDSSAGKLKTEKIIIDYAFDGRFFTGVD